MTVAAGSAWLSREGTLVLVVEELTGSRADDLRCVAWFDDGGEPAERRWMRLSLEALSRDEAGWTRLA